LAFKSWPSLSHYRGAKHKAARAKGKSGLFRLGHAPPPALGGLARLAAPQKHTHRKTAKKTKAAKFSNPLKFKSTATHYK
jgi:hypothetical protein